MEEIKISKDIDDLISKVEKTQQKKASVQDELRSLRLENNKQKQEIEELKKKVEEQKSKLDKMIETPGDVMELRVLIGKQRAEIESFEDKLNEKNWKVTELESEIDMLKKQREDLRSKLSNLREETNETKNEFEVVQQKAKNLEMELEATKKFLEEAGVSRGDISELRIKLGHIDARVAEKEKVIASLQEDLKRRETKEIELLKQCEQMQTDMDGLESEIREVYEKKEMEIRENMLKLQKELGDKKIELAKLNTSITDKDFEIQQIKSELERYELKAGAESKEIEKAKKSALDFEKGLKNLKALMETEPLFRIYLILREVNSLNMAEIAKAISQSVANTRRLVMRLEKYKLVDLDDETVSIALEK
jgi:chromosome segregation ATPase